MSGLIDRLTHWLGAGFARPHPADEDEASSGRPPVTPLGFVRLEFIDSLEDVSTPQAADLVRRIGLARSLRALWHLRSEVFGIVSCHCDQAEASERVARLNRHFPNRAPRSSFGGFDVLPEADPKRG